MESVVLVIHLVLALALIGVVLMQRSEGGGLGMGGGGGGLMSARGAATALGKITWGLAGAFIVTSLALTIIAKQSTSGTSVLDGVAVETPAAADTPALPGLGGDLLPPTSTTEPAADATTTETPADPNLPPAPAGQ